MSMNDAEPDSERAARRLRISKRQTNDADLTSPPARPKSKQPQTYGRVNIDDIVKATLELLRHHSREDITITMIAAHTNTKRSSIYRYFKGMDELYHHLSGVYLGEIRPFVLDYVIKRTPRSFDEVVVYVIDAAIEFFNNSHSLDRTVAILLQLNVTSFVTGYHGETVTLFEALWRVDWPIDRNSELHPFRVLAMLITAVFEVSLRKHGRITDAYADEVRHVALSYVKNVDCRFGSQRNLDEGSAEQRIATAVQAILSTAQPEQIETCVEILEALARRATKS